MIDIIGFSRGAALALHFANMIAAHEDAPPIRFLGLWDCVPSFGIASIDLNIGWNLKLPDTVEKCFHALALDERRSSFKLNRLEARVGHANQEGRLFEVWFRGVHSDVGGGNMNPGLSSIALNWILKKAQRCGLPIDAQVVEENAVKIKPDTDISDAPWYDLIEDPFRIVRWNDQVHDSVAFRPDVGKYNNPPEGVTLVNDEGEIAGEFRVPAD